MQMVFKRNDNKLDCCRYCQWFSGVVYYIEMFGYIAQGNLNIRIHRDITGEMWFGVEKTLTLKLVQRAGAGQPLLHQNFILIMGLDLSISFPNDLNNSF